MDVAHLIFPDNVQTMPAAEDAIAGSPKGRMADRRITPSEASFNEALTAFKAAKRPMIIVGYGAKAAMDDIIAFAERLNVPIATTFKAKGQIPDNHPLAAGVLGRSGTPIASWFMNECDLIIALGSSFSKHTGIEKSKPIIQVDFDPLQLGRFHAIEYPVLGEIGVTVNAFSAEIKKPSMIDQRSEIADRWKIWNAEKENRREDKSDKGLSSAVIFDVLSKLTPDDAVISVDVGNNTYSFGRYFECRGQSVLMSGYLGSIGFSFPAAMGAWAATQDKTEFKGRKVVSISGDGGFGQYAMEFTTAVKYGMNITHILLNNDQLGKISKEQRGGDWPVWQTTLHNLNFAGFARACGGHGKRVTKAEDLHKAIEEALAYDGPSLVEIISDPDLI